MGTRVWLWERVAGVAAACIVALIFLAGGCERIELISYDWRMRWFADPPGHRIVIVAIDNPSLKELATWADRLRAGSGPRSRDRAGGTSTRSKAIFPTASGTAKPRWT